MYYQIQGTNVRLAGSMHLVPVGATIPQWILDAYEWSDEIYLEANKDDLPKHAYLPVGDSSESKMSAGLWATLKTRWPPNHPYGALGPHKLWFIAPVVALSGIPLLLGVEHVVMERVKADSRAIKYLETVGEFAELMDGIPDADYVRAFALILNSTDDMRARNIAATYEAWIGGQAEAVATAIRSSPLALLPMVRERLFDMRNAMWLPRIIDLLPTNKRTVIYVGAGHLGGPHGLLSLLERTGHYVMPLSTN